MSSPLERIEAWGDLFRKPHADRLRWEQPLRTALLRRLLRLAFVAEMAFLLLGSFGVIRSIFFPWDVLEAVALLALAQWLSMRGRITTSASLLLCSLAHVAAFTIAHYGPRHPAAALLLPTIVISALIVGGYYITWWTAICAALLLWVCSLHRVPDWPALSFWWSIYIVVAYLAWLFSSHLEQLLAAVTVAEEEQRHAVLGERLRLAREIHDTLAQGFTGVVVQLPTPAEPLLDDRPEATQHVQRARELARHSLDEARRSILALRTGEFEEGAILAAVVGTGLLRNGPHSATLESVEHGTPRPLPAEVKEQLVRAGQEALANAIRHADAKRIEVSLHWTDDDVELQVQDDGSGFNSSRRGFGIQGMVERMARAGGRMQIDSQTGGGTRVTLHLSIAR